MAAQAGGAQQPVTASGMAAELHVYTWTSLTAYIHYAVAGTSSVCDIILDTSGANI